MTRPLEVAAMTLSRLARACAVAGLVLVATLAQEKAGHTAPSPPRPDGRERVLVYYGNETPAGAADQSANLKSVLSTLRQSGTDLGGELAHIIETDLTQFRDQTDRDRTALIDASKRIGFDLAIFTNALARRQQFQVYRRRQDKLETRFLPKLPSGGAEILSLTPLARPEALKIALASIATLYAPSPVDVVLVTFSHGSVDMALMPRVNTDLSAPGARDAFSESLRRGGGGAAPDWAKPQGTDKKTYWKILDEVGRETGIRFPLVFRQACASGPADWAEFGQIPESVMKIAHSARYNINVEQIDYAHLFQSGRHGADWIGLMSEGLDARNIIISDRRTIWVWAGLASLASLHPAVFFVPFLAWLAFYGPGMARRLKLMVSASSPKPASSRPEESALEPFGPTRR